MKKILFVEKKLRADKLGILYLSAVLKEAGHSTDLIQCDVDDIDTYMTDNKPDVLMYSVMSGEHKWFTQINAELKKKYKFVSVMGGAHFTFFPEAGEKDDAIDFVVIGPGEHVVVDIVEGKISNKVIKGLIPKSLEELPHPDRSILYKYDQFGKSKMKRFIATRDCKNACTYCFNHTYHRIFKDQKSNFFQKTSPEKMVQEIKDVKNKYGLELVYFNDDDLTDNHEWIIEFCKIYKEEINLPFCGSIRANSVDHDILDLLMDAGCTFLNIALESANPETQKYLNRGNISNEQIEDVCVYAESIGIKIRLQNMIGLPVENSYQDAIDTLKFNQKINPTDSWASIFQPFPKTKIWEQCMERGLIDENTESNNFYESSVLKIENIEKIDRLHKWWYFAIKYQMPIELVEILLEQPLTEDVKEKIQNYRWETTAKIIYGL